MPARTLLAAIALLLAMHPAAAQDRPLIEPFRIGYAQEQPIAERLRSAGTLERALRRKGFLVAWQSFASGLDAMRALNAQEVDLALDVSLHDVIVAKREHLKMVFMAELSSIAPSCCDLEQLYADHIFKRYTLSSEYFADRREDVLLIVHREMVRALQQRPDQLVVQQGSLGPIPVATVDPRDAGKATIAPVTRTSMLEVQRALVAICPNDSVDLTDSNYWSPEQ